ncbi:MAG: hypothetical protein JXA52_03720, partial [Planctomycetes bacterium]|nr:hypothetical protein [Planctomycetota bacterium]
MKKLLVLGIGLLAVVMLVTPGAAASPYVSLLDIQDFQSSLDSGNIQPAPEASDDVTFHYPDSVFSPPDLYVMDTVPEDNDGGLVMSWGDNSDEEFAAQWRYVYEEDPNLVGWTIKAQVLAPVGINSISLGIYDLPTPVPGGMARSWTWTVGPAGVIPHGVITWVTAYIAPAGLGTVADAPGASSFFDNGVDPTNILSLGFDENGNGAGMAQAVPGSSPPIFQPWNYWGAILVVPEPATISLLALGGLVTGI